MKTHRYLTFLVLLTSFAASVPQARGVSKEIIQLQTQEIGRAHV